MRRTCVRLRVVQVVARVARAGPARLDLAEHERLAVGDHEVELAEARAVVAGEHRQPRRSKCSAASSSPRRPSVLRASEAMAACSGRGRNATARGGYEFVAEMSRKCAGRRCARPDAGEAAAGRHAGRRRCGGEARSVRGGTAGDEAARRCEARRRATRRREGARRRDCARRDGGRRGGERCQARRRATRRRDGARRDGGRRDGQTVRGGTAGDEAARGDRRRAGSTGGEANARAAGEGCPQCPASTLGPPGGTNSTIDVSEGKREATRWPRAHASFGAGVPGGAAGRRDRKVESAARCSRSRDRRFVDQGRQSRRSTPRRVRRQRPPARPPPEARGQAGPRPAGHGQTRDAAARDAAAPPRGRPQIRSTPNPITRAITSSRRDRSPVARIAWWEGRCSTKR